MSNSYAVLWTTIYTYLNADATLQGLLGGAGRIGRGSPPKKLDYSGSKGYLVISDVESISENFQSDTGNIIVTAWAAAKKVPITIQDRVSELLIGYDPLAWTQQMTRSSKQGAQTVTGDNLAFARDTYKIPLRIL